MGGKEATAKKNKRVEADRKYATQKIAAKVRWNKAKRAHGKEKAAKKASESGSKAEEKQTKAHNKADLAIKECATDGSECRSGNVCKKVGSKGPFFCSDLVTCCKTKPAEKADSGLSWAGFNDKSFPEIKVKEPVFHMPKMPKEELEEVEFVEENKTPKEVDTKHKAAVAKAKKAHAATVKKANGHYKKQ